MRTVSAKELDRMKKRGGVKVKRRAGMKKPEPEVKEAAALSGANAPETPVPALEMYPAIENISKILTRMESRDEPKEIGGVLIVAKRELEEQDARKHQITVEVKKAVSNAVRSESDSLARIGKAQVVVSTKRARTPWTHIPHRDRTGHIDRVVSSDENGNIWTHDIVRENQLISEVVSIPG